MDSFDYWMHRLLILQEGQKSLSEIEVVQCAIGEALGDSGCNIIRNVSIRPLQKTVYFHFVDGREIDSRNLSDGYKRLVNIVTDLSVPLLYSEWQEIRYGVLYMRRRELC